MGRVMARRILRVAAQGHDMAHAHVPIVLGDGIDFLGRGVDAGQVCRRQQVGFAEQAFDRGVGALAGRAAGAVGHRNVLGVQGREALDAVP